MDGMLFDIHPLGESIKDPRLFFPCLPCSPWFRTKVFRLNRFAEVSKQSPFIRRVGYWLTVFALLAIAKPSFSADNPPSFTLLAAGDIAQCSQPGAAQTAALIEKIPGTVLAVGDLAYPKGTHADFARCYAPAWGRFKSRTLPVPGNHEYQTPNAAGYFDYFGKRAGEPGKGYYSVDQGGWHIVALNSNIAAGANSEQVKWLRDDLAANRHRCILAFWHHPRFTSGYHGNDAGTAVLWDTLYEAGASVVIAGHDHDYERFAPMNGKGQRDDQRGIRSFVAGTGGAKLYDFNLRTEVSEAWNASSWGVLKLELHADGYDWEFMPVAGGTFHDAGSAKCVMK